ncbi:MFS transporter [Mucilaginibacter pedocola]|uniref:MFS transporter n=2 Tax=Mucilaginibacter pedocola TaxID=1792845 RepID=A0A1S9P6K6_9SPHI|nr:MFS transporter [Mucilaginibacter pedocola]
MNDNRTLNTASATSWNAVYALSLAVSGLIISEFLPVSLLTPIAKDLLIAEGQAGQAISITALVAMISSLITPADTGGYDRRNVLLLLGLLQVIANFLVGFANSYVLLLTGRIILGIGLGGFWSLCVATVMRLVPSHSLPTALSVVFGAVSAATVIAAPLSSFLGIIIGWRSVFFATSGLGMIALLWQALALPSISGSKPPALRTIVLLFKRPGMLAGMMAVALVFAGYGIFFTYLRPFLETLTGVSGPHIATVLLCFSLANLAGTTLGRFPLEKDIYKTLTCCSLMMGAMVGLTVVFAYQVIAVSCLTALWGLLFGIAQIGWNMWITRTVPDEAESGGGALVATIQLGIMIGAAAGGFFYDHFGGKVNYITGSVVAVAAALTGMIAFQKQKGRADAKK